METRGTCRAEQTPGPALCRECGRGAAQARLRHRRTRGVKGQRVSGEAGSWGQPFHVTLCLLWGSLGWVVLTNGALLSWTLLGQRFWCVGGSQAWARSPPCSKTLC